ncbi:MAG: hypothetical protein AABX88_03185 [Nanoarchaeota archaeon]
MASGLDKKLKIAEELLDEGAGVIIIPNLLKESSVYLKKVIDKNPSYFVREEVEIDGQDKTIHKLTISKNQNYFNQVD